MAVPPQLKDCRKSVAQQRSIITNKPTKGAHWFAGGFRESAVVTNLTLCSVMLFAAGSQGSLGRL